MWALLHILSKVTRPLLRFAKIWLSPSVILPTIIIPIITGLVANWQLPWVSDLKPFTRQHLGRLKGVDLYAVLGDIVVPNQLVAAFSDRLHLSDRVKYWESCLITAPVPQVLPSGISETQLTIPWTLLPLSVVESITDADPSFGADVEYILGLKNDPKEWRFERIMKIAVPLNSAFSQSSGMRTIYTVNLFDFMEDFGNHYREALSDAVSRSVMETLERSGTAGDQSFAIPALAAATYVHDRELVLNYDESFDAILDGLDRTRSRVPTQVYLVLWWRIRQQAELHSAVAGLNRALYVRLPEWNEAFRKGIALAAAIGFVLGLLLVLVRRHRHVTQRQIWRMILLGGLAVGTAVGSNYAQWSSDLIGTGGHPGLTIGLVTGLAMVAGIVIESIAQGRGGIDL